VTTGNSLPVTADSARPQIHEWNASDQWRVIEFMSDLHLSPLAPATSAAWAAHLQHTDADAVVILGDLFEVWVGDDARCDAFEARCLEVLARTSARCWVGFMAGNRDFLLGESALADAGVTLLPDPTVLCAFGQRVLLTHGDALCLADVEYQRFRAEVRSPAWRAQFLSRSLVERRQLAAAMRDASEQRQRARGRAAYGDIDSAAAAEWSRLARAPVLIHGHTHQPVSEPMTTALTRHVLSDWHHDDGSARGDTLRLSAAGIRRSIARATP